MTMPSSAHLRVEQVSDLSAGLLDSTEASRAEAHLASCDQCSVLVGDLAATRRLLAADGADPPAMPSDVAARLDAAFAAERRQPLLTASARTPTSQQVAAPARHPAPRRPRYAWLPQALVAAASVAVLGAAIGIGATQLGGQDDAGSVDAQGAGVASRAEGGAPEFKAGGAQPEAADGDAKSPAQQESTAFDDLRSATLADQLNRLLPKTAAPAVSSAQRLDDATRSCARSALGREPSSTWSVYPAELDGRPVQLVVATTGSEPVRAWALDCTGSPRVVATVPTD